MRIVVVAALILVCGCATSLQRLDRRVRATPWHAQQIVLPEGDEAEAAVRRLAERITNQLTAVVIWGDTSAYGEGVAGVALLVNGRNHVLVNATLHWNARLIVLAHEAGHLLEPPLEVTAEREVFAAAVGYLVCDRLGFGQWAAAHETYLSRYKGELHVLTDYRADIEYAVDLLAPRAAAGLADDNGYSEPSLPPTDIEWTGPR